MALPAIQFFPINDIHLLRGMSINLIDSLLVGNQTALIFQTSNPGVVYRFTPFFKNTSGVGNLHTGCNITIDTTIGAISTLAAAPIPEKRNFLVKATATLGTETLETFIRIHIHQSIAEAWLSPSLLTVQKILGNSCKFSVRVRFNDNVVADISEGDTFNTFPNQRYQISWSHPTIPTLVFPTGTIDPNAAPTTGELPDPVTATITPAGGTAITATGRLFIADQLAGANPQVKAQLVTTGRCPGFIRAEEVPNVLFIPDGFHPDDKDVFDRIVDDYISDLVSGKITAPFDMLAGSINFWKVFISSGDRGVTTRADMYVRQSEGKLVSNLIPSPVKPLKENGDPEEDSTKWNYLNLLYHVGLPLRDDVSDLVRTEAALKGEWKLTTALTVGQVIDIPADAITNWRILGERRLPEERDTVLGITVNNYCAPSHDRDYDMINFNRKRMQRTGLNSFFNTLTDTDGNPVGKYFVAMNDVRVVAGKDSGKIALITAASTGRAQNIGVGFFSTIRQNSSFEMEQTDITLKKMAIKFDNEIEAFDLGKKATLTHELGHSFGLEDEYGEDPPNDTWSGKFINEDQAISAWDFSRYKKAASLLDWSANVVARTDLLSLNTNIPGTNMLDANKLKWRYHRIANCAVATAVITATANPNEYKFSARPGHVEGFATAQKAFVRKRIKFKFRVSRTIGLVAVPPQDVVMVVPDSIHFTNATLTAINVGSQQITVIDANGTSYVLTFVSGASAGLFNIGDTVTISRVMVNNPIYAVERTAAPPPNTPAVSDTIIPSISQELEVVSVNNTTNEIIFKTSDSNPLNPVMLTTELGNEIIFYRPMDAPSSVKTSTYKYAEVISKKVLDYLVANPFSFSAKPDAAHGNTITDKIDSDAEQDSSIPGSLVPSCTSQKKKIVAIYSGGDQHHGDIYHPTGRCFMRNQYHDETLEEFCVVCKYTLVNMINPRKHEELNNKYSNKIYPT